MSQWQVLDLSHTIIPNEEEYRLEIDTRQSEQWPQFAKYKRDKDSWYIISEVTLNMHVGTHIELPYHHFEDGQDAADFPLDGLIGEATVVDISAFGNNSRIGLEDLEPLVAGQVKKGDIAYFYTGLDRYYRTEKQHYRPWFTTEAIQWLAKGIEIKVMGVDTSGIEIRNADGSPSVGQPNHEALLGEGIPLVEYMTNLASLISKRFFTYILPVKLKGAEAFPVRIIGVPLKGQD